jgi:hypothetical protein
MGRSSPVALLRVRLVLSDDDLVGMPRRVRRNWD